MEDNTYLSKKNPPLYGDPQLLLYTNPNSSRLSCPVTTDNIDIDCRSLYKSS